MNLKDSLLQYCDTQKEIEELIARINKLKKKQGVTWDTVLASEGAGGQVKEKVIWGFDTKLATKLKKQELLLQERQDRLLEQQIKVAEFIDQIPNSRLRQVFTYKYLDKLSWTKIAHQVSNEKKTYTADGLRVEHDRFLKKN